MTNFVVNLNDDQDKKDTRADDAKSIIRRKDYVDDDVPPKRGGFRKFLKIFAAICLLILIGGGIGGFFYWRSLKQTPQYSLALLVDAARRGDQKAVDELVDTDAVVDDFMPQITDKAVELYGRGLAPATIQKIAQAAAPLLPAVKQRARLEVPNLIREKTSQFNNYPFWTIAVGAGNFLDITTESQTAFVKSKIPDRPLEVTMKRSGDKWQIVAIRDEVLARRVAEKIGQDLIANAQKNGVKKAGEQFGVQNLEDILKRSEGIFK